MLASLRLDWFRLGRAKAWRRGLLASLLLASTLGMTLPAELQTTCNPAQCFREAQGPESDADLHDTGDDGDCSGPFHFCHCCAHVQLLPLRVSWAIAPAHLTGREPPALPSAGDLAGHRAPLLRPPSDARV